MPHNEVVKIAKELIELDNETESTILIYEKIIHSGKEQQLIELLKPWSLYTPSMSDWTILDRRQLIIHKI